MSLFDLTPSDFISVVWFSYLHGMICKMWRVRCEKSHRVNRALNNHLSVHSLTEESKPITQQNLIKLLLYDTPEVWLWTHRGLPSAHPLLTPVINCRLIDPTSQTIAMARRIFCFFFNRIRNFNNDTFFGVQLCCRNFICIKWLNNNPFSLKKNVKFIKKNQSSVHPSTSGCLYQSNDGIYL